MVMDNLHKLKRRIQASVLAMSAAVLSGGAPIAHAEVKEVFLGQQFGAVYMPMMVMEEQKLVEKHLAAAGLADVKVTWAKMGGPSALVDAFLSGNLHFAAQGTPSLALLWDRTKGGLGVKALSGICNNNIWLNTRNPAVKSLKDFSEKDRIGIPSLKVSTQALMLQIASEKEWGKGQHGKLDPIIVSLAHPDSMAAVLSPAHEVSAHFATSPFHEAEIKAGLKTVATAYEIVGGPVSGLNWVSHEKFRTENPKIFAAVAKALDEGMGWINADKPRAAKWFIEYTKDKKVSVEDMTKLMLSPDLEFTKTPGRAGVIADFMHSVGTLKSKPTSWKDLYFEEAHGLPGS
jgi:NitT/TauT family transport system substrate-binding protein